MKNLPFIVSLAFLSTLLVMTSFGVIPGCSSDDDSNGDGDGGTSTDDDSGTSTDDGTCLGEIAWYSPNSSGKAEEVGQKDPNAYGLYDMIGNAIEWVADCYSTSYDGAPDDGSAWMDGDCDYHVMRGGCYGSTPRALRVSWRDGYMSNFYGACLPGVRCVRSTNQQADGGVQEVDGGAGDDLEWASIPAGTFDMGCSTGDEECYDNESPVHSVEIESFEMTATEITQEVYFNTTGLSPGDYYCPQCAATKVSWENAKAFCETIGARLPTEAEWEYAARGETTTEYYCMDQ